MVERKYFEINESLAKSGKAMWSMSDYVDGSSTEAYRKEVDRIYDLAEKVGIVKPTREVEAISIAEKFSKAYSEWLNKGFSIEMQYPSVLICGAGNFNKQKKEKQNKARESHQLKYKEIYEKVEKLNDILNGKEIIKSGDCDAVKQLMEKLTRLEEKQEFMKELNSFYRKNKTCVGFRDFSDETARKLDISISEGYEKKPYATYMLTNNNANIRSTKERLESLLKAKQTESEEFLATDVCRVFMNTEIMRMQLFFEDKPEAVVRQVLKDNGFHWSSSQAAWQRPLTDNAKYSTKKVIKKLEEMAV